MKKIDEKFELQLANENDIFENINEGIEEMKIMNAPNYSQKMSHDRWMKNKIQEQENIINFLRKEK